MKEGIDMKLNERKTLLRGVISDGKKAYKDLELSKKDAEGLIKLIDAEGLFTSKSQKIKNFIKHLESLMDDKQEEKKNDTEKAEQTILSILEDKEDTKEEIKEEVKPVETKEEVKEEVKEEKVANKKATTKKEKLAIAIENYKKEFYSAYGDPVERKKINNFLRCECTNEELFDYFELSDLTINKLGLSMLKDKAVFILECEGEFERMTIVDKDIKDGKTYLLVKSLDTKNYDRIYLDNWDSKAKAFKHSVGDENYIFNFYMPVLKKGVKLD